MPTPQGISVKRAIASIEPGLRQQFCESSGIPNSALEALSRDDDEAFVKIRANYLAEEERKFMNQWGALPLPAAGTEWGETDIDTE
jgi:hypothetical protein